MDLGPFAQDQWTTHNLMRNLGVRFDSLIAWRIQPRLDVYNLFNSSDVNSLITRYGSTWLSPKRCLALGWSSSALKSPFDTPDNVRKGRIAEVRNLATRRELPSCYRRSLWLTKRWREA
jgi:hypothetical protein